MRVLSALVLLTACLAYAHAARGAEAGHVFALANAIRDWIATLREQALRLFLYNSSHGFLPSVSQVLSELVVTRPAARRGPQIVDVPRPHFVAFGPGGVLPDFEGPFSVDAVYRNKRWGRDAYFAVWSGYYEDRKVAVGVDAHTTYSDICQFLAAHNQGAAASGLLQQMRQWLQAGTDTYERVLHTVVQQLLIRCERYFVWESAALAGVLGSWRYAPGTLLFYWLHWALWWNSVRGAYSLSLRLARPAPAAAATSKTRLHDLVPDTSLQWALRLTDGAAALVFASPASVAHALVYAARLASVRMHTRVWDSVYLGHRLALLRRCAGSMRHNRP